MSQKEEPPPYTPIESPNSLISSSRIKLVDIICEGPISGFALKSGIYGADPLTSIYFDDVQVRNLDGSFNFNASGSSFILDYKLGYTGQAPMENFQKIETAIPLSSNNLVSLPPINAGPQKNVIVSFNSNTYPDADMIKITTKIPSLLNYSTKGDVFGYEIRWAVDISLNNGPFIEQEERIALGKCTSPYLSTAFYPLPKTETPQEFYEWKVRVRRTTQNIMSATTQNELYVDSICVVSNSSFSYPSTALVGLQLSAEQFLSIPVRAYEIMGMMISVPVGYSPTTYHGDGTVTAAIYPEIWNGQFNTELKWTDNPAWIFYDLITNKRYGLGNYIKADWVDKWTLYEIAQYCDELIDNGNGGLEPRFTCNVALQQRTEAYNLLMNLSSVFRGMLYWTNGRLFSTFTNDKSPIYNFTNANVIDGKFSYSDTAKNTRSTVIKVRWTDPQNLYRESIEYVEDTDGIIKYGYIEKDITAFACTSKGQALRIANWALQTEKLLTETITFQVGLDGNFIRPGDLFNVYDNFRNNQQQGGRIKSYDFTTIELDRPITLQSGFNYALSIVNPKYNLEATGEITGSNQSQYIRNPQIEDKGVITSAGANITKLTVNDAYTNINNGSIWLLYSSGNAPSTFLEKTSYRCLALSESQDKNIEVLGLIYRTGLNYSTETGYSVKTVPVNPTNTGTIEPPSGLLIQLQTGLQLNNLFFSYFRVSWTGINSPNLAYYQLSGQAFGGVWEKIANSQSTYGNYTVTNTGRYNFKVASVNNGGKVSTYLSGYETVSSSNPLGGPPRLSGIYISENYDSNLIDGSGYYTGYLGVNPKINWRLPLDSNGNVDAKTQFLSGYRFHLLNPNNNAELLSPTVSYPYTTKSHQLDRSTFQNLIGGERRDLKVYIETIDIYGNSTSGASLIINNIAPSTQVSTPKFYVDQENLSYNISANPRDKDLSGIYLWYNTGAGITPSFGNHNEVSPNFVGTLNTKITGDYSIYWSIIDTFGRSGCTINGPTNIISTNASVPTGVISALNNFSGAFASSLTGSNTFISGLQNQVDTLITGLQNEINVRTTGVNYSITGLQNEINVRTTGIQTEIGNRISGFNSLLSGQSGNYNLITGEIYSRQTGDAAEIVSRQLQISSLSGYTTGAIYTTNTTFSNATGSLASSITTLIAATGNIVAAINTEALVRQSGIESLAQTTSNIISQLNTNDGDIQNAMNTGTYAVAYIQTVETALTTASGALASSITTIAANLQTSGQNLTSAIQQEATSRATGDAAETLIRSTQISSLSGYTTSSINTVNSTISTTSGVLAGSITTIAANLQTSGQNLTSAIQNEATARATGDSAETTIRSTQISSLSGYTTSAISTTNSTFSNATGSLASSITTLFAGSGALQSYINNEIIARQTGDSAETTIRSTQISSLSGYTTSAISTTNSTFSNATGSLASQVTTLFAASGALQAIINNEVTARQTGDSAETSIRSTQISSLSGYVALVSGATTNRAQASIDTLSNTLVSTSGVLASQTTNVQAKLDATGAIVQTLNQAFITGGQAVARWGMTVTAGAGSNRAIAGIEAVASNGESPISAIRFLANILQVCSTVDGTTYYPFQIVSGVTYINEAMIKTASITSAHIQNAAIGTAQIQDLSVTSAKVGDIYSNNYISGSTGFALLKDGTSVFGNDAFVAAGIALKRGYPIPGLEPSSSESRILMNNNTTDTLATAGIYAMKYTGNGLTAPRGWINWTQDSPGPSRTMWGGYVGNNDANSQYISQVTENSFDTPAEIGTETKIVSTNNVRLIAPKIMNYGNLIVTGYISGRAGYAISHPTETKSKIQHGSGICDGGFYTTVTFPTAFSSTPTVVATIASTTDISAANAGLTVYNITTTAFSLVMRDPGYAGYAGPFNWIAIGT